MIVDRNIGRVDTVVVRGGRVIHVSGSSQRPYAPVDAIVLAAPAGAVAPGMLYDAGRQVFLPPVADALQLPASRVAGVSVVPQAPSAIPAVAMVPASVPVPAVSVSIVNTNSAGAPPSSPAESPGVSSVGRPLGDSFPAPSPLSPGEGRGEFLAPSALGASLPRDRAVQALRGLQVEAWPPERERFADLAATFLTYQDESLVPDLVRIVPAGYSVGDVARLALEARETAQAWILAIGQLINEESALVASDEDADRLIARGRAIVEGQS